MAVVARQKFVQAGDWRTLESGWNATFGCIFHDPAGAQIKIRYGGGWWFGWDSQKQTLDGKSDKSVNVGRPSLVYARVQIRVQHDTTVRYTYIPTGP